MKLSELVAFCDINTIRMNYSNKLLQEKYDQPAGQYVKKPIRVEDMIREKKPDYVMA